MLIPVSDRIHPESAPPVLVQTDGPIATLILNQPERRNSLGADLTTALAHALEDAIADPAIRVIVVTNTGSTFCAGADLKAAAPGLAGNTGRTFTEVFEIIAASPTPVIGRIDGHAMGGGVGLVAVCDISVMRADAAMGFTEVRLGVAPAVISVVCLPKMRVGDAHELFLTGERFSPDRAADMGLITASVPPEQLDAAVDRYVRSILRGGPHAIAAAKHLIRRVPTMSAADAFTWTSQLSRELFASEEAQAGIAAFTERRRAPWDESEGGQDDPDGHKPSNTNLGRPATPPHSDDSSSESGLL